jgi:hypothetical protein
MNENAFATLFDSSDDDALSRAIDRFADGEFDVEEEAELFARLDATPDAWKQCALALAEARDLRAALSGAGRWRLDHDERRSAVDVQVALAASLPPNGSSSAANRRTLASWWAIAAGLLLAFAAGFVIAPRSSADAPSLADGQDSRSGEVLPIRTADEIAGPRPQWRNADQIASGAQYESTPSESTPGAANGPEIVNVVYRHSGDAEETSAPLPVYRSDEDWARALDEVVRQSEADLAPRRAQLLAQGADLERQILLHPVSTEQGEMLLPVETYQIVPVSLNSFH